MKVLEFTDRLISRIGTAYTDLDCIGLVRYAAKIRCQGTNWLWRSYNNSERYRYLKFRLERAPTLTELKDGMLVFRINWDKVPNGYDDKPNCYHVGVIIGDKVIQSQERKGVNLSEYNPLQWDACGWLKQIDYAGATAPEEDMAPETTPDDLTDHQMIKAIYDYIFKSYD